MKELDSEKGKVVRKLKEFIKWQGEIAERLGLSADQMDILEKITSEMRDDEEPSNDDEGALVLGGESWKTNNRLNAQTAKNPAFFEGYSISGKEVLEALRESGVLAELSRERLAPEDASKKNDNDDRYA